ncbi:MAG: hypothetical protein QOJ51_6560 [Acidobacteriaceae bacterium]|nr:hypothetical protein [Acidobacteriaceae bacterium]
MVLSSVPEQGPSLLLIEGCLTAIVFAVAFCWPRLGSAWFSRAERTFGGLARRKSLSVAVAGLAAFLLRLAILPLLPIPQPFVHDDFSFLLAADTFASGRLTNPTPAMWTHFESFHITVKPTYMSMYFPAQGLVLAAGKILTGHPWFGILVVTALMCSAICWMLQAWLPPTWALLGGILVVLRIGLFSYWIDTYSGGGSIAALGGALVLGALPRFMKKARFGDAMLMAVGVVLLGTCRPYDGMLLCLPVIFFLTWWMVFGKNRPTASVLLRRTALPLALIVAAGAWMGYYDYRVFGSPVTLPYTVDRAEYAIAPYFVWQSQRPVPVYRHQVIREFYNRDELNNFRNIHSLSGFVSQTLVKAANGMLFYAGLALLVPLIMVRRVLLDQRLRFLIWCVLVLMAGQFVEIFFFPHYLAPFTAAFYAIGLQAMRHLRLWSPGDQPVGMTLTRLIVTLCVVLTGMRLGAKPLHLGLPVWPGAWASAWYGSDKRSSAPRAQIESRLEQKPGRQLVIVRYHVDHNPMDEWVYNAADIDNSKVIWARDMHEAENLQLIEYYKDRTVWLIQPDTKPESVSPYLSPAQSPTKVSR